MLIPIIQVILFTTLTVGLFAYGCLCWERRNSPIFHLMVALLNIYWLVVSRVDVQFIPDWLISLFESDTGSTLWLGSAFWGLAHLSWGIWITRKGRPNEWH